MHFSRVSVPKARRSSANRTRLVKSRTRGNAHPVLRGSGTRSPGNPATAPLPDLTLSNRPAGSHSFLPIQGARHIRGRVAPEDYSSEAPTDPDVQIFRIRLFGSRFRYATIAGRMCGSGSG